MQLKLVLGAVLSAVVLCVTPVTQTTAAAAETYSIVSPLYEIAKDTWINLSINVSSATCTSKARAYDAVEIVAEQTLQKQGFLWIWSTYDDAEWTKTVNAPTISMSNTKSGLGSGKYRLKTVFTLTDKQGKTETITVYSDEKSV